MAGSISTLMSSGIDAFTNLWDIGLRFPGEDIEDFNYSARATDFNPPELSLSTTTVDYKAIQITKQVPKIEGDRRFNITFRMDASFDIYSKLLAWKHIWVNPSGESIIQAGGMSNAIEEASKYGAIRVVAYNAALDSSNYSDATNAAGTITEFDPTSAVSAYWEFYDVICTKVGSPTFQRGNADFVTVQAEFIFGRYREPGTTESI